MKTNKSSLICKKCSQQSHCGKKQAVKTNAVKWGWQINFANLQWPPLKEQSSYRGCFFFARIAAEPFSFRSVYSKHDTGGTFHLKTNDSRIAVSMTVLENLCTCFRSVVFVFIFQGWQSATQNKEKNREKNTRLILGKELSNHLYLEISSFAQIC